MNAKISRWIATKSVFFKISTLLHLRDFSLENDLRVFNCPSGNMRFSLFNSRIALKSAEKA